MHSSSRWRAESRGLFGLGLLGAALVGGCVSDAPQVTSCVLGTTECGGECVTLAVTPQHCGACGRACASGEACLEGSCLCTGEVCVPPDSPPGTVGECVDTQSHPDHCGACNAPCGDGRFCLDGACVAPCADGLESCDGRCIDTRTDREHCGGCGVTCQPGATCEASACTCRAGLTACGDACIDVQSNADHCGDCDQPCAAGEICAGSSCVGACGGSPCMPGEVAWGQRIASATAAVNLGGIAVFDDGDLVVAGTFGGELDLGSGQVATALGTDIFVARYDPRGRPRWLKRFGLSGQAQRVGGLAVANDRIVIGGAVVGNVDFDGQMVTASSLDALLLELDGSGAVTKVESFGGGGQQRIEDVAIRPGGVVAVGAYRVGLSRGGLSLTTDDTTTDDGFVLSIDDDGSLAWSSAITDPTATNTQLAVAVDAASDGRVAVAARVVGGGAEWDGRSVGGAGTDGAVALFDGAGVPTWYVSWSGPGDDRIEDVLVRTSEVVAVGHASSTTSLIGDDAAPCPNDVTSTGGRDGVALGLAGVLGCPAWTQVLEGPGDASLAAVTGDAQGALALLGTFTGDLSHATMGTLATGAAANTGVALALDPVTGPTWTQPFGAASCVGTGCTAAHLGEWLVIGGSYLGTVVFRESPLANAAASDGFLARLRR